MLYHASCFRLVPPGRTVRSRAGSPAVDGTVLALGAHLHNYAEGLRWPALNRQDAMYLAHVWSTLAAPQVERHTGT